MSLQPVKADLPAVGLPFPWGLKAGNLVFLSGNGPLGPDGKPVEGDIRDQTRLTLENLRKVAEAAGSDLHHVVSLTVYLKDLRDFAAMNDVYREFFPEDPRPARATVQATLLFDMKIEIQGIAVLP